MKARLILSLLMSSIMVLMVTLLVTYLNLGARLRTSCCSGPRPMSIAWPVAAGTAFTIMPGCRRLTDRIVARLEQTA